MARADDTELIDTFEEFYRSYYRNQIGELAQKYPNKQKSLYIDWEDLYRFDPHLADDFRNKPAQLREYAEEALRLYDLPVDVSLGQAHVRIRGLPEQTAISNIRADHRGMLICIQGTVGKASDVKPKTTTATFECQRCGTLTRVPQEGGDFQEPHECQGCERQGPFRINYNQSEFIDGQELYVREAETGAGEGDAAGIKVEIEDDITGEVTIGDEVAVTGILKFAQEGSNRSKSSTFNTYMEGFTVETVNPYELVDITDEDKKEIIELSNESDIYEQFEQSIAPTVYGMEQEKRALTFQLFSGVTKQFEDGTQVRGNIHTLFITDPGTFVERVLESAAKCSPHTVEVDGSETSGTGLTTTGMRSSSSSNGGGWSIGAGPLIEADQGHALIKDVSDLRGDAQSSLETVLKRQSVDASKATASETFEARTSVMAVDNPTYGRFDQYEPIGEQIDLNGDVIGAFDLIFPIVDQPEEEDDARQAKHTLRTAYSGELGTHREEMSNSDYTEEEIESIREGVAPAIEPELLRKYVIYARRNCYPTITEEAKDLLQDFYVQERARGADEDAPVPFSQQKLETLVRLAEASARIRLSDTVEKEDAERATSLFKYCLEEIGMDPETGEFDADVVETGTSKSQRERIKNIKHLISIIEDEHDEGAPVDVIIERAEEEGIERNKVEHEIEKLKDKGEAYEPRKDHLRTT